MTYLDVAHSRNKQQVSVLPQTWIIEKLSARHQTVLAMFLGFRKPLYSCTEGILMCHSSTHPDTSLHMTQFYQAFSHINTASDKHWGEKAWVQANNHAHSGFHYPYPRSENACVSVFSIGNKCTYKSTVYVDKINVRYVTGVY